ncbi:Ulp1 family isopeptidase [endosymbiont GvMRE of Glomus versiforme]|uniref:Ulp1 family isopeptidase n=1 Tax=endosymbiont GvMRE of Glomus versiforme TaxID=2039283 RepID=UPI0011C4360C|nr:Ulp1 family isopeptidase [endosymbiont GvMRE of Glomus versiforme]
MESLKSDPLQNAREAAIKAVKDHWEKQADSDGKINNKPISTFLGPIWEKRIKNSGNAEKINEERDDLIEMIDDEIKLTSPTINDTNASVNSSTPATSSSDDVPPPPPPPPSKGNLPPPPPPPPPPSKGTPLPSPNNLKPKLKQPPQRTDNSNKKVSEEKSSLFKEMAITSPFVVEKLDKKATDSERKLGFSPNSNFDYFKITNAEIGGKGVNWVAFKKSRELEDEVKKFSEANKGSTIEINDISPEVEFAGLKELYDQVIEEINDFWSLSEDKKIKELVDNKKGLEANDNFFINRVKLELIKKEIKKLRDGKLREKNNEILKLQITIKNYEKKLEKLKDSLSEDADLNDRIDSLETKISENNKKIKDLRAKTITLNDNEIDGIISLNEEKLAKAIQIARETEPNSIIFKNESELEDKELKAALTKELKEFNNFNIENLQEKSFGKDWKEELGKKNWKSEIDNYKQELIGKIDHSKSGSLTEDNKNRLYCKMFRKQPEHILYLNEYSFNVISTSSRKKKKKIDVNTEKLITSLAKLIRESRLNIQEMTNQGQADGYWGSDFDWKNCLRGNIKITNEKTQKVNTIEDRRTAAIAAVNQHWDNNQTGGQLNSKDKAAILGNAWEAKINTLTEQETINTEKVNLIGLIDNEKVLDNAVKKRRFFLLLTNSLLTKLTTPPKNREFTREELIDLSNKILTYQQAYKPELNEFLNITITNVIEKIANKLEKREETVESSSLFETPLSIDLDIYDKEETVHKSIEEGSTEQTSRTEPSGPEPTPLGEEEINKENSKTNDDARTRSNWQNIAIKAVNQHWIDNETDGLRDKNTVLGGNNWQDAFNTLITQTDINRERDRLKGSIDNELNNWKRNKEIELDRKKAKFSFVFEKVRKLGKSEKDNLKLEDENFIDELEESDVFEVKVIYESGRVSSAFISLKRPDEDGWDDDNENLIKNNKLINEVQEGKRLFFASQFYLDERKETRESEVVKFEDKIKNDEQNRSLFFIYESHGTVLLNYWENIYDILLNDINQATEKAINTFDDRINKLDYTNLPKSKTRLVLENAWKSRQEELVKTNEGSFTSLLQSSQQENSKTISINSEPESSSSNSFTSPSSSSGSYDWKDINSNFTTQSAEAWQKNGFTYEQTRDWNNIHASNDQEQAIKEPEFYAYLRDEIVLSPEQVLNDNSISLADLKDKFREYTANENNRWLMGDDIKKAYDSFKENRELRNVFLLDPLYLGDLASGNSREEKERKIDTLINKRLNENELVFLPANKENNHWSLFVYEKSKKTLHYYDSYGNSSFPYFKPLCKEIFAKLGISAGEIENHLKVEKMPQQNNGYDCGVYVIAATRALLERYRQDKEFNDWSLDDKEDFKFSIEEERELLKTQNTFSNFSDETNKNKNKANKGNRETEQQEERVREQNEKVAETNTVNGWRNAAIAAVNRHWDDNKTGEEVNGRNKADVLGNTWENTIRALTTENTINAQREHLKGLIDDEKLLEEGATEGMAGDFFAWTEAEAEQDEKKRKIALKILSMARLRWWKTAIAAVNTYWIANQNNNHINGQTLIEILGVNWQNRIQTKTTATEINQERNHLIDLLNRAKMNEISRQEAERLAREATEKEKQTAERLNREKAEQETRKKQEQEEKDRHEKELAQREQTYDDLLKEIELSDNPEKVSLDQLNYQDLRDGRTREKLETAKRNRQAKLENEKLAREEAQKEYYEKISDLQETAVKQIETEWKNKKINGKSLDQIIPTDWQERILFETDEEEINRLLEFYLKAIVKEEEKIPETQNQEVSGDDLEKVKKEAQNILEKPVEEELKTKINELNNLANSNKQEWIKQEKENEQLLLTMVCELIKKSPSLTQSKQVSKEFIQKLCQRNNLKLPDDNWKELEQITLQQEVVAYTQKMQSLILNKQIEETKASSTSHLEKSNHAFIWGGLGIAALGGIIAISVIKIKNYKKVS